MVKSSILEASGQDGRPLYRPLRSPRTGLRSPSLRTRPEPLTSRRSTHPTLHRPVRRSAPPACWFCIDGFVKLGSQEGRRPRASKSLRCGGRTAGGGCACAEIGQRLHHGLALRRVWICSEKILVGGDCRVALAFELQDTRAGDTCVIAFRAIQRAGLAVSLRRLGIFAHLLVHDAQILSASSRSEAGAAPCVYSSNARRAFASSPEWK